MLRTLANRLACSTLQAGMWRAVSTAGQTKAAVGVRTLPMTPLERSTLIYRLKSLTFNSHGIAGKAEAECMKICDRIASTPYPITMITPLYTLTKALVFGGIHHERLWRKVIESFIAKEDISLVNSVYLVSMAYYVYGATLCSNAEKRHIETMWKYVSLSDITAMDVKHFAYLVHVSQNPAEITKEYTEFSNLLIKRIEEDKSLNYLTFTVALNSRVQQNNPVSRALRMRFDAYFADAAAKHVDIPISALTKLLKNAAPIDSKMCIPLTVLAEHAIQKLDFKKPSVAQNLAKFFSKAGRLCVPQERVAALVLEKLKSPDVYARMNSNQICNMADMFVPFLSFPKDDGFMKMLSPHLLKAVPKSASMGLKAIAGLKATSYSEPEFWKAAKSLVEDMIVHPSNLMSKVGLWYLFELCVVLDIKKELVSGSLDMLLTMKRANEMQPHELVTVCKLASKCATWDAVKSVTTKVFPEYIKTRATTLSAQNLIDLIRFLKQTEHELGWMCCDKATIKRMMDLVDGRLSEIKDKTIEGQLKLQRNFLELKLQLP